MGPASRSGRDSSRPALTIRDLLAETEFGLGLLAGEHRGDEAVEGIHLSELEDPTPWMVPRSLLLSTGLNLVSDPAFGARLVEAMARAGMAGIGISLGHYVDTLPEVMVRRAQELSLPLFTAPMSVPFRRITAYVYLALSSQDTYRLRRTLSLQSHLLELLLEERGPADLVAQLAELLETTVFLFDGQGELVAEAQTQARFSARSRKALWGGYREHRERHEPLPSFQFSGYRVSYREACLYGRVDRVLVAAYANRPIPELAETTLSFAQKLITLDRLRERDVAALERRMRVGLLDDLVSGIGSERDLRERMVYHGLDASAWWRVAVLDIEDVTGRYSRGSDRTEEQIQELKTALVESAERFLGDHGLPYLTVPKSDTVAVLIQFGDTDRAAAERTFAPLSRTTEQEVGAITVSIGVSAPGRGPAAAPSAFRQALEAADLAKRRGGRRIRFFDQLHPEERLLETQSPEALVAIYEDTVAPLVEHDRRRHSHLVDTLKAYLEADRSVGAAAAALHMHRNTLTKRLERIEALLGLSLSANDDLVSLTLGLRAWELLAGSTEPGTGAGAGSLAAWEAGPAPPPGRAGSSVTR